ncbi:MAG TPA: flavodoxin [Thermoleophilia bacterium]|nr:flavodoxin [Thermoleophilia bacterium]
MKALVVYESLWGNTAAVAAAIAEGLGPEARALSTADAVGPALADADLIVAGSPVLAFKLPTEKVRESLRATPPGAPGPADLSHPSMSSWLGALPAGSGHSAAFDTRIRGPFGSAAAAIGKALERAGYQSIAKPTGFVVAGKYGPLRAGELERAQAWGEELGRVMG